MEISQIDSTVDLINFYCEKDSNKNGMLEEGEVEGVSQYDRDGDGFLKPWEMMEAVNLQRSAQIFQDSVIESFRHPSRQDIHIAMRTTLEENADVLGITFRAGTDLIFYLGSDETEIMATLGGRTTIDEIRFQAGTSVTVGMDGTLREARLTGSAVVQETRFGDGTRLSFGGNGLLERAFLVNETKIKGVRYDEYNGVTFYENGQVQEGELDREEDPLIDGVRYNGGTYIMFYENGQVRFGYPAGNVRAYGYRFTALTDDGVQFYEDGTLQFGGLVEDATLQEIELTKDTLLSFYPDGHIEVIYRAPDDVVTVHGATYSLAGSNCVSFYPNGQVRIGTLAADATFDDQAVSAGQRVCFDEAGHVIQCEPAD